MRVEGRVRDVVASGEAVVETEHGIVFVRGGLRDERLVIALDPKSHKPARGRVLSVLSPAPERVQPACAHALRCGGCPLMHASLAQQRTLKLGFLREALRKAGLDPAFPLAETLAHEVLGYRRRARLSFQVARGARKLGYRRERSHELADVEHCVVLEPALAGALRSARETLLPGLAGEGELLLAQGREGRPVLVLLCQAAQAPALYAACDGLVKAGQIAGVALYAAGATQPARFGDPSEWSLDLNGLPLEGTMGGFSQAHAEINRRLVARVRERVEPAGQKLLELYAGHGNFTVALAGSAAAYTAIEQDAAALAALRTNLAARGLSAKVVQADALGYAIPAGLDVALLDPPRAGAPGLLSRLGQRKVRRIVYVSCDPQTLGRDLSELLGKGYHASWAEAFEMFPQTPDLETLVVLERD
jgi:23S rRNA (uracil1939-C5)-methyltransferase